MSYNIYEIIIIMTTMQDKPRSYTQRMSDFLCENGVSQDVLVLIKEFSTAESQKMEEKRELTKNLFTWGKYANKRIEDVYKLDKQYCAWAMKSSYLKEDQKLLIQKLMNA